MTTYAKQYYLDLISQQIEANEKDADELMVQRLYDVPGIADMVLDIIMTADDRVDRAYFLRKLGDAIEQAVFAAIEKSPGEMAEIEAMQTPDPDDPYDDPAQIAADSNAMLDLQGARRV